MYNNNILTDILCVKLIAYAEEITWEYVGVFQRGRSTADQIFTMRQILKKCWELNTDVHHLFIDFQTAYDTVWSKEIGSEMRKLGVPKI
jgi:hypothetical protein